LKRAIAFFSNWTIPLLLLVSLWTVSNVKWSGNHWSYIVTSDGKGYYSYLPAIFIYHDPNFAYFDRIEKKYYDEHTKYRFCSGTQEGTVDKYFCGVALLQSPFFFAAHGLTLATSGEADGYSKLYMLFISLAGIFYLGIGLVCLRRFLRMHGASGGIASFITSLFFFGTNLFYYALIEPAMSHVYSFALVSLFLVYGKKWMDTDMLRYAVRSAVLLGLIIVVRPVNILIAGWLVIEAGSFSLFFGRLKSVFTSVKHLLLCSFLILFPFSLQLLYYYWATGHFFVDSYGEERFYFLRPELVNFLFSYKKGLFVYLPLTFISIGGIFAMARTDRFRAIAAVAFLLSTIYILSCWWMWYYGGSFGTRVMVEFLPVFALLLFYLFRGIRKPAITKSLAGLCILIAIFCQLQTWQYRYEIIHWADMTKEKYWDAFLKLKK
jgi:hypothetical protein